MIDPQGKESSDVPRKPRRRWWQISLRTLLILALGLSWFVIRGERQRRSVASFEAMGGVVFYDTPEERFLDLTRWLPRDYLDNVTHVRLVGHRMTDAGAAHLGVLTRLQGVDLRATPLTDAGLVHLHGLSRLKWLNLSGTQVTDVGVAHLQSSGRLETLDLDGTQVTDAGLAHLKDLSRLDRLSLRATQVTDAGLVHLEGLDRLQWLYLDHTNVTGAGAAKLRKVLPKTRISR